jgi:acylphosphatase
VRNRFDGSVEVLAMGPLAKLEQLRKRLEIGPPAARVQSVTCDRLNSGDADVRQYRSFYIEGDA